MSQNTHNVRTRREQLAAYPESVCVGRYSGDTLQLELDGDDLDADRLVEGPVLYVRCDIAHRSQTEAEARGATEAGEKWAATQLLSASKVLDEKNANVAALETRVKELEGKLKRAERWAEVAHQSCMGTGPKQALGETLNGLHQFLCAALTREGGV